MNSPVRSDGANAFANRLAKNCKHLSKWAKREQVSCYRVYDADIPEYAVAVDYYQSATSTDQFWIHVQEYEAPKKIDTQKAELRLHEVLEVIQQHFACNKEAIYLKVRRQQKGKAQYEKIAANSAFYQVAEGGHRFWVNFADYLDTGLFLDHRITRGMVQQLAEGKRFLNLFAYTGSATVYAAAGKAATTTTVDMSRTYLEWAQKNMLLNGYVGHAHNFEQADCINWIKQQAGKAKFDLIFLDPPSFSTSKRMNTTFDVQRDHVSLLRATMKLLARDGTLIFSNNLRSFKMAKDELAEFSIQDLSRATLPKDFERNPRIHNCWKIT